MISIGTVRKLALALEGVDEKPHFEKISFRVKSKIFATVDLKANMVVLKLSENDQSVFYKYDSSIIYPVPVAWGNKGWTMVEMKKVKRDLFTDALITAYCTVAPAKLSDKYRAK